MRTERQPTEKKIYQKDKNLEGARRRRLMVMDIDKKKYNDKEKYQETNDFESLHQPSNEASSPFFASRTLKMRTGKVGKDRHVIEIELGKQLI